MSQKLLVIDDSLTVRKLVELSFRDAGWTMEFAGSGGEGLSKALASSPDLVLLDYVLPDMKAIEVCERLAASRKTSAWPSIILMSAKMERVRDQFKPYPMVVDFVGKPFTSAEITQLAERALAKGSSPSIPAVAVAPANGTAAAGHGGTFTFKQKEAAANTMFQRLRRELGSIPDWMRGLGATPPAPFFARKILTPDVVESLLDGLLPFYRELLATHTPRPPETSGDEPMLQGQISAWPLRDLMHVLQSSSRTGELWIFHGAQTVISYWQGGEAILVTSQDPTDYARDAQVSLASLPAGELERAELEQRSTGKPFYVALHERGHLRGQDIGALLERQGLRVLEEALAARSARFVWRERATLPSWVESHGVHLDIRPAAEPAGSGPHTIAQLTLERMRRPSTWSDAEPHLAGPEALYSRSTAFSAKLTQVRLSANEQRVLTPIDGRTTLTGIAEKTGIAAKEVARILYRLAAVDLISASVSRPSSRHSARPVMILEPDRDGFHMPLRTLLRRRAEPLELVDLAGEPDLLGAIKRERPSLVILNDSATGSNVIDVARAIRAIPQLANVSLAAVLESRAKAKMDDLAAAGFDAVLVKPVLYSDLSKLIASSNLAAHSTSQQEETETHGEDPRR